MSLIGHVTQYEIGPMVGLYLLGVLTGVAVAWTFGRWWGRRP